jgi:Flp pilus assembly protein TadB
VKISAEESQGLSVEQALLRARDRTQSEGFSMILTALMISARQGGDLIEIMERISDSIRALDRLRKKILSETSDVRAQRTIVLWMNPVAVIMICALGSSMRHILFGTWKGTLIIIVAFVIQFACLERIRTIERSAI